MKRKLMNYSALVLILIFFTMTFGVTNTAFAEETEGFYEDFEDFETTPQTTSFTFKGWNNIFYTVTQPMDVIAEESVLQSGKSVQFLTRNKEEKIGLGGLTKQANITSTEDPVKLSADVYIPTAENGVRQLTRLFVTRGTSEEQVQESQEVATPYRPDRIASYGLAFDTKGGSEWNVYMLEPNSTNAYAEVSVKAGDESLKITGGEKITVDIVYYPDKLQADYFLNGKHIFSSSKNYMARTEEYGKIGNVVILSGGASEDSEQAVFDNIHIHKLKNYGQDVIFDTIEGGRENVDVKWNRPICTDTVKTENITVERFAPEDIFMTTPQNIYGYTAENITETGFLLVFDAPLPDDGSKYRVTVSGAKGLYDISRSFIYDFVSGDAADMEIEAVRFGDKYGNVFGKDAAGAMSILIYSDIANSLDDSDLALSVGGKTVGFTGKAKENLYVMTLNEPISSNAQCSLFVSGLTTDALSFNSGENNEAYLEIGDTHEIKNISTVRTTGYGMPELLEIDGQNVWKVSGDINKNISFDICQGFGNSSIDGSSFLIEIEYFDDDEYILPKKDDGLGFFTVWIDKMNYGMQMVKYVPMLGDNKWKKVVIEVDDADFQNEGSLESDIILSLYDRNSASTYAVSGASLYLKSLKVTKLERQKPILVESYTDAVANTFAYFENKQIKNTFTNTQDQDARITVDYYLTDKFGDTKYTYSEELFVPANSSVYSVVDIKCNECGLFEWVIKVTENGNSIWFDEDTLCIVKTAEDGLKPTFSWICCHLHRYSEEAQRTCMELIKLANIKGVRLTNNWSDIESATGLDVENTLIWNAANLLDEYGINYWVLLQGCKTSYQDGTSKNSSKIPVTDKEIAGWEAFCRHAIEKYATRGVELFEIWNEPDQKSFNPMDATPEQLVKITQIAKRVANELYAEGKIPNPVKIAGLSTTNVNVNSVYENWLKPALEAGLIGGEYGIDILNLHTYQTSITPELIKTYNSVNKYRDYIYEQTGVKDIPVLISEYGNSEADIYVTEDRCRDWNIRSLILYKMYGIGDQVAIYNLEETGVHINSKQQNYGLISPVHKDLHIEGKTGIPTEAYLSYAAMNYVMRGEITPIEILDCGTNLKINHLSRDTLGDEVIAFWTAYDSGRVCLDLGTTSVTYYDCFGNEHIMRSEDGVYDIEIDNSVSYITGNFGKVEVLDTYCGIYEDFSDYLSQDIIANIPDKWRRSSLSTNAEGAHISNVVIDNEHETSLRIASLECYENNEPTYGNHAVIREAGYKIKDDTPVRFHAEFMIEDGDLTVLPQNQYRLAVTSTSVAGKTLFGFKIANTVGYWDQSKANFVMTEHSLDVGKWIKFDAIYYPKDAEAHYFVNGIEIGRGEVTLDESCILGHILLAAQTIGGTSTEAELAGIFDNICLVDYCTQESSLMMLDAECYIENEQVIFDATAGNFYDLPETATIFTAIYDECGRMKDVVQKSICLEGGEIKRFLTAVENETTDWMQARFFVWNKESLTPLLSVHKVKKN